MSGEPKTLTTEQAVDLARKYLEKYLDADHWYDELTEKWPEELEADYRLLLEGGVRVVARDEAAELRAALDAARDAMVSALAYHHHSLSNPVKEELNAAINRAGRALAGGESEK